MCRSVIKHVIARHFRAKFGTEKEILFYYHRISRTIIIRSLFVGKLGLDLHIKWFYRRENGFNGFHPVPG